MTILDEVKQHRNEIFTIADQCGCTNIKVFGSSVRGEETDSSDIDFLVTIKEGHNLFDMARFQRLVQKIFVRKVDVALEKGLHWSIKKDVLKEARPL